jgi:hypothetical protein
LEVCASSTTREAWAKPRWPAHDFRVADKSENAKALGLTIPETLLATASKVIE